jgi:3-phenylpropionate/trans-cinnamate dioxygenase ferredoxin reductase subunit
MGKRVTVLAQQERLLASVGTPEIAAFLHAEHHRNDVLIRTGVSVAGIETREGRASAVLTTTGERLPADVVLVAIGVEPETRLAEAAGLACDNGIVVDEFARSSDPHIVAAGDCTRHPNTVMGRSLRLESVHNAVQQAKTAAATLAGKQRAYAQAPWFWSDQLGHRLQGVGLAPRDCQRIVRGDPASGRFAVWCFEGERLVGCQALNRPSEYMACRRMLDNAILPSPEDVAHPRFDPEARLPRKAPLGFQRLARA